MKMIISRYDELGKMHVECNVKYEIIEQIDDKILVKASDYYWDSKQNRLRKNGDAMYYYVLYKDFLCCVISQINYTYCDKQEFTDRIKTHDFDYEISEQAQKEWAEKVKEYKQNLLLAEERDKERAELKKQEEQRKYDAIIAHVSDVIKNNGIIAEGEELILFLKHNNIKIHPRQHNSIIRAFNIEITARRITGYDYISKNRKALFNFSKANELLAAVAV